MVGIEIGVFRRGIQMVWAFREGPGGGDKGQHAGAAARAGMTKTPSMTLFPPHLRIISIEFELRDRFTVVAEGDGTCGS